MRKLPSAELLPTPWKNGGGETVEIAVSPLGATLDNFHWRVSSARVASPGPFSPFPGVERTLAVIRGGPLQLVVSDGEPPRHERPAKVLNLNHQSEPYRFAGEWNVHAQPLGDGPVIDFNVMTRRDCCTHQMQRLDLHGHVEICGAVPVLYCVVGALSCRDVAADAQSPVTLVAGDALIATGDDAANTVNLCLAVEADLTARVFVANIDSPGDGHG